MLGERDGGRAMWTADAATCDVCGAPARVHVLIGYSAGRPLRRHCCLACAPRTDVPGTEAEPSRGRTRPTSLAMGLGLLIAMSGLLKDWVFPHTTAGFGRYQWSALLLAIGAFVVGVAARADVVAIGSLMLVAATLLADLIGQTASPGLGWKQGLTIEVGLLVVAVAYLIRRRSDRSRAARAGRSALATPSGSGREQDNDDATS